MAKKTVIPEGRDGMEIRVMKLMVAKPGESLFEQSVISVEIDDLAAGEFIVVKAPTEKTDGESNVGIDPEQWPALRSAIDFMVGQCRKDS